MKNEVATQMSRNMIDVLLDVHALSSMHRVSGVEEYRRAAARWLPTLRSQMDRLSEELTKEDGK